MPPSIPLLESHPPLSRDTSEAMVNLTLDDTSPFIIYSDGWGVQSPQDPDLDLYLQDTYHGTETVASNATIVFSGTGIYLYGSTGPDHGNFEVSVNGAVQTFSGFSTTPMYQQCLFSSMLDADYNTVVLINIGGPSGNYMDLDYVITTVPENTTFPAQPSLPPITPSAGFQTATFSSSSPASQAASSSSSPATTSTATTILTVVFALLSVVLLIILALVYVRHRRRKREQDEQAFRYGNNPPRDQPMANLHWTSRTESPGPAPGAQQTQPPPRGPPVRPQRSPPGSSLAAERGSHHQAGKRGQPNNNRQTFLPGFDV